MQMCQVALFPVGLIIRLYRVPSRRGRHRFSLSVTRPRRLEEVVTQYLSQMVYSWCVDPHPLCESICDTTRVTGCASVTLGTRHKTSVQTDQVGAAVVVRQYIEKIRRQVEPQNNN